MVAVDELGVIEVESRKTPDTSEVTGDIIAFAKRWLSPQKREDWQNVLLDRGGGGKQHADRLRAQGYEVRTVAFGEGILADIRRGTSKVPFATRLEMREDRYVYVNRRAEMYGEASMLFDPSINPRGFGLPRGRRGDPYWELSRQLAGIPRLRDGEGRLYLPAKNKKDPDSREKTLTEILGCSPDEADAFVLACWGMLHEPRKVVAGPHAQPRFSSDMVGSIQR
jgi:hypothetical protein